MGFRADSAAERWISGGGGVGVSANPPLHLAAVRRHGANQKVFQAAGFSLGPDRADLAGEGRPIAHLAIELPKPALNVR